MYKQVKNNCKKHIKNTKRIQKTHITQLMIFETFNTSDERKKMLYQYNILSKICINNTKMTLVGFKCHNFTR